MILIEIDGVPENWVSHAGYGKRSFNPKHYKREQVRWQVKSQYNQVAPLFGPIRANYTFHCPIPKGTSKARTLQMLNGMMHPIKRPDLDNFNKFLSDSLTGIVWEDDSQVVELISRKIYGEKPKTVIKVEAICH